MEIQWQSCRGTISFPEVMNLSCLRLWMPKPKLESPSKDSEPKTEAQTEPSRKRSSIVILDGEEIEEF